MALKQGLLADVAWSLLALGIVVAGALGFVALGALREPIAATPFERVVTIALEERAAALIPGLFEGTSAPATASTTFAGVTRTFEARVTRVAAALDARTRTLDVTVALGDPVRASDTPPPAGLPPALVNAWAEVAIEGAATGVVHAVASSLVREDDTLWLMADGALDIVPVTVLQLEDGIAYLALNAPPADGAMLVTSLLPAPVDGMPVRAEGAEPSTEPSAEPSVDSTRLGVAR